MVRTFFWHIMDNIVRVTREIHTSAFGHRELVADFNRVLEDRTKVVLEYMKQVSTISHNSIHDQIQKTEHQINEHTRKIYENAMSPLEQMTNIQDNMDSIVRTVNVTETKIASLSSNIEKLRQAIADATDDVRSFDLRRLGR